MGSWLAHELLERSLEVSFLLREGPARKIAWKFVSSDVTTPHEVEGIDSLGGISRAHSPLLVIVTTRANDLAGLWTSQLSTLPRTSGDKIAPAIMICCNGWVADQIAEWSQKRPDLHFVVAVTTAGVTRGQNNSFLRTDAAGKIWWGPLQSTHSVHHEVFSWEKSLPPVFVRDEAIVERARCKWLFNTAANTLAGILKLPRNHLMIDVHRNQLRELFDEAYDLGCERWPQWHARAQVEPGRREALWGELCRLIRETGANENSMSRAARTRSGTSEALFLGGLAFGRTGYPALKKATSLLLRGEPSFPGARGDQSHHP